TWINPIRHFTDITKQIYLKDASLGIVWGSLWPLLVIAATTGSEIALSKLRSQHHRGAWRRNSGRLSPAP
ncbi:hypothetical protein MJI47_29075, partial [Salmonella enterica subsp. enterica serovar Kentucky]|nr:hypothetical protein [Salmonella enterica subsp. enterica serovar Kentucky]